MKLRDLSFSIALCASLLLHAGLFLGIVHYGAGRWIAPRPAVVRVAPPPHEDQHPIYDPTPIAPPVEQPDSAFGAAQGKGKAINQIPGDQPQKARQAPEE